ncbi:hypothetical protein As57867_015559, partial [Aphanomyces stellatus]
ASLLSLPRLHFVHLWLPPCHWQYHYVHGRFAAPPPTPAPPPPNIWHPRPRHVVRRRPQFCPLLWRVVSAGRASGPLQHEHVLCVLGLHGAMRGVYFPQRRYRSMPRTNTSPFGTIGAAFALNQGTLPFQSHSSCSQSTTASTPRKPNDFRPRAKSTLLCPHCQPQQSQTKARTPQAWPLPHHCHCSRSV